MRSRQVLHLKNTQAPNPYPHKFHVTRSITSYIDTYGKEGKIPPGTKLEGVTESLAGRVHNIRASGTKLIFYDLHGEGKKVQIMATQQSVFFLYAYIHVSQQKNVEMLPTPSRSSPLTSTSSGVT